MRLIALALLWICTAVNAGPMCGLNQPGVGQDFIFGRSANGQWLVTWNLFEDTGVFENSTSARMTRQFCVLAGRPLSIATFGSRVQKINTATDQQAAFDAAWALYVITPLSDPKMAAVRADLCADAAARLPTYKLEVCK